MRERPLRREREPERETPAREPERAEQPAFHPMAIPAYVNGRWVIVGWGC